MAADLWAEFNPQPLGSAPLPSPPQAPEKQFDAPKAALDLKRTELGLQKDAIELQQAQAEGTDPKLQEAERTAAFLATRLKGSVDDVIRATREDATAQKPSLGGVTAGVMGAEARNWANSPARRRVENAQLDILDAALTLGTGAAYTREQLEAYRDSLFPRLTDDPATIADKKMRLRRLIEAAKIKAGKAAPLIDEALAMLEAEASSGLSDEQAQAELRERIARGDAPAATIKWLIDSGRPPTDEQIAAIIANAGNRNPDVRPPEDGPDLGRAFAVGLGDVVEGAGDVVGLVGNPLNAGINWATGLDLSTDLGKTFREASGLPSPQSDQEQLASAINKGGVAALGFGGAARAAAPLTRGVVQNALTRFGGTPVVDTVTGATGAASGEVARQMGAGPVGQTVATLVGGAAGVPVGSRVNALFQGAEAAPQNALVNAGKAEGVTVNRAMVDPSVQNRVTGVEATMAGGPIVRREMGKIGGEIESGVKALGRGGEALEPHVAGQTVQRASERYIQTSGQQAKRLYDRAEKAAEGVKVAPSRSLQVVDETIAKLSETPETNAAEIAFLEKLKSDFQNDLSVGALRRLRTGLRKRISKGELTFGENEKDVLSVMDAAADDIAAGLTAAGKRNAVSLFKRADTEYRDRMEFINGTVQKIIGKRNSNASPERVFANFRAMASPKGDAAGLARMIRTMDPEEQADIAATFADELGKNSKGEFSTAFLLSQAEKLPRSARMNLFGPEGTRSLDNLLKLAKEHSRVMGGLNNSRTGVANDWRSWLVNFIFGGSAGIGTNLLTESGVTAAVVGSAVGLSGAGVKASRDILSARALMSPEITKWLASAPKTNSPKAINTHIARLSSIAAREPALAADVQALMRALNDNGLRSATAEENQNQ